MIGRPSWPLLPRSIKRKWKRKTDSHEHTSYQPCSIKRKWKLFSPPFYPPWRPLVVQLKENGNMSITENRLVSGAGRVQLKENGNIENAKRIVKNILDVQLKENRKDLFMQIIVMSLSSSSIKKPVTCQLTRSRHILVQ